MHEWRRLILQVFSASPLSVSNSRNLSSFCQNLDNLLMTSFMYYGPNWKLNRQKKDNQADSFCQALRTQAMYEYSGDQLQDSNIPMAEGEIFEVVEEDTDG